MAKVLGVGGVFFKSPDPSKLNAWYERWLGMPISASGTFFQPDTVPENGGTVWSAFNASTTYFAPSDQAFMINLMVDDLEAAVAQVKEGGAQVVGEIQRYDYGDFGWFIDPDGHKVELWQPKAG